MNIYYKVLIAALCIFGGIWLIQQRNKGEDRSNCLIIGVAADYAPYVSMNHNGDHEGFDIDVAHAIADTMGKKLVIKDFGSMPALFMALEQEMVDTLLWGISITKSRLEKVDFVPYHGDIVTEYPLIFWKTLPKHITTLADMKGKSVCVEPSSAQGSVLHNYKDSLTVIPTERVDDAFLMVQQGKADAALVDLAIAQKFKDRYPEIQICMIPLATDEQSYGMGMPIKKTRQGVKAQLEKAVTVLKENGMIQSLEKKWGVV